MTRSLEEQIKVSERSMEHHKSQIQPDGHMPLINRLELEFNEDNVNYLRALEIIISKIIDLKGHYHLVNVFDDYDTYVINFRYNFDWFEENCLLTKEEFNIVKEVLKVWNLNKQ